MIVAKTRMRKIPDTCKDCKLSYHDRFTWERACAITEKPCPWERSPNGNARYGKPGWCPLVELKDGESNE